MIEEETPAAAAEGSYGPERSRASGSVRSEAYLARKLQWRDTPIETSHPSGFPVKDGVDEVDLHKLTETQFRCFDEAKQKEVDSIIKENQALRPLSVEESRKMLEQFPQKAVRSRFHYLMKPKDTAKGIEYVPKVRWVMLGFEDPDIHELSASSPSPALQTINVVLTIIAGYGWTAKQLDFTCAFLQGKPVERLLLVLQPEEGLEVTSRISCRADPGDGQGIVWKCCCTLMVEKLPSSRLGRTDPCMFVMKADGKMDNSMGMNKDMFEDMITDQITEKTKELLRKDLSVVETFGEIDGIMILLTDDILCGGNARHDKALTELMSKYKTGRRTDFTKSGGVFNGRRIRQARDGSFSVDMSDYLKEKVRGLEIPKERKKEPESDATSAEKEAFRTILMKAMWVARQARPEIIGSCAILSSKSQQPKVKDLIELSKVISHLKAEPDLTIKIPAIPPCKLRLCIIVDASPSTLTQEAQFGIIVAFTDVRMAKDEESPWIPVMWRSGKIERKCSSSLSAESFALTQALGCAELTWTTFLEGSNARLRIQSSIVENKTVRMASRYAKSLFDGIRETSGTRGRDSRITLACAEAREGLAILGARPRWVPHNAMLVDGLTKLMSKANSGPLLLARRTGKYQLSSEWVELANRKHQRERGEIVPRRKVMALTVQRTVWVRVGLGSNSHWSETVAWHCWQFQIGRTVKLCPHDMCAVAKLSDGSHEAS
eukprot:2537560-Amphidinium_carterae.3